MKKPFDETLPVEKRVKQLERVVSRLLRRQKKRASGIIAPYPISSCVSGDIKGDILKYMFPSEGLIKYCVLYFKSKLKEDVQINMALANADGGEVKTTVTKKQFISHEVDINTKKGDRLKVSILSEDDEPVENEVWISILWIPKVKDADVRSFLVDELEVEAGLIEE